MNVGPGGIETLANSRVSLCNLSSLNCDNTPALVLWIVGLEAYIIIPSLADFPKLSTVKSGTHFNNLSFPLLSVPRSGYYLFWSFLPSSAYLLSKLTLTVSSTQSKVIGKKTSQLSHCLYQVVLWACLSETVLIFSWCRRAQPAVHSTIPKQVVLGYIKKLA